MPSIQYIASHHYCQLALISLENQRGQWREWRNYIDGPEAHLEGCA